MLQATSLLLRTFVLAALVATAVLVTPKGLFLAVFPSGPAPPGSAACIAPFTVHRGSVLQSNCIKQALTILKPEFICSPKQAPFHCAWLQSSPQPPSGPSLDGTRAHPCSPPGPLTRAAILGQLRLPLASPQPPAPPAGLTGGSQLSLQSAALLGSSPAWPTPPIWPLPSSCLSAL